MSYLAISRHIVCMDMHVDMIGIDWMGADAVLGPMLPCISVLTVDHAPCHPAFRAPVFAFASRNVFLSWFSFFCSLACAILNFLPVKKMSCLSAGSFKKLNRAYEAFRMPHRLRWSSGISLDHRLAVWMMLQGQHSVGLLGGSKNFYMILGVDKCQFPRSCRNFWSSLRKIAEGHGSRIDFESFFRRSLR